MGTFFSSCMDGGGGSSERLRSGSRDSDHEAAAAPGPKDDDLEQETTARGPAAARDEGLGDDAHEVVSLGTCEVGASAFAAARRGPCASGRATTFDVERLGGANAPAAAWL